MSKDRVSEFVEQSSQNKRPQRLRKNSGTRSFERSKKGLRSFGPTPEGEEKGARQERRANELRHRENRPLSRGSNTSNRFSQKRDRSDFKGEIGERKPRRFQEKTEHKRLEQKAWEFRPEEKLKGTRGRDRSERFGKRGEMSHQGTRRRLSFKSREEDITGRPERSRLASHTRHKPASKQPFHPTFRGFYNGGQSAKAKTTRSAAIPHKKEKTKDVLAALSPNKLDPLDIERNSITLQHSVLVATAVRKLAERIEGVDPDLAFAAGLYHDFGKFYLPRGWVYKHPRLGYELLQTLKKDKPILANVCLAHPFPDIDNEAYFALFCRGDQVEAQALKEQLEPLQSGIPPLNAPLDPENTEGILLRLVQLCDKLSGVDRYVSLEEKFAWYEQWVLQPANKGEEVTEKSKSLEMRTRKVNYDAWRTIKNQIEALIHEEVYKILGIVSAA